MVSYGEVHAAFLHAKAFQPFYSHPSLCYGPSAPQTIPAPHYFKRSSALESHPIYLTVAASVFAISHLPVVVLRLFSMHPASSCPVPRCYVRKCYIFPIALLICRLVSSPWERGLQEKW